MFSKLSSLFLYVQLNRSITESASSTKQSVLIHPAISEANTSESLAHFLKHEELRWIVSAGTKWVSEARSYYLIGNDGSALSIQISHGNIA